MQKFLVGYLFLLAITANPAVAQEISLPPSIEYEVQSELLIQELPAVPWLLEEGEQALSPEALQRGDYKDARLLLSGEYDRFPISAHRSYWFKISLSSDQALANWVLDIFPSGKFGPWPFTYEKVAIYSLRGTTPYLQGESGYKTRESKRDIKGIYRKSLIRLDQEVEENPDLWIKVAMAENSQIKIGISMVAPVINLKTYPNPSNYSQGILQLGAFLALMVLGVFLLVWLRDRVYKWFILLLTVAILSACFNLNIDGFTTLLFPENPWLRPVLVAFLEMAKWVILVHFGRVYINTNLHFPTIDKFLKGLVIYLSLMGGLSMINSLLPAAFSNLWSKFWIFLLPIWAFVGVLIYFIFSSNKLARFYSIGAILPFIGMLLVPVFKDYNLMDNFNPEIFISLGPVLMLTLALAYRFHLLNIQKEKAQQQQLNLEREKLTLEKEKSTQLEQINIASAKFVPTAFLNFLGKQNILDATLGDFVEKQVTVLFSDLRDYTTLSEQMTPEENFRFVNAFNKRMGPIIQQHQGFINQYLGDGLMAIFPENTEDTLKAAIVMQQTLQEYNQKRISKKKLPVRMGIGIHAGPLIMGIIGDDQRMDAATISDTVNVASRVEGLTKHFGVSILISEAVLALLPNQQAFNLRYLGLVQVKGKEEVIRIYECFDGDPTEILLLKKATSPDFEKGMMNYYNKAFQQAKDSFDKVLMKNPDDPVVKLFKQKCRVLMENGADFNWTGVELMSFK